MNKPIQLLSLILILMGGFAGSAQAEMSKVGEQAIIKAGEIMFQYRCRSCHSDDMSHPSYGPPLKNVFGRKAGSVPGFNYSQALIGSGIIWNEEKLRAWIADNKSVMPGTRMRHVGIMDKAEQDFLLGYLKHISK